MTTSKATEASRKFNEILQKETFLPANPFSGLTEKQIEEVTSMVSLTPGQTLVVFFRDRDGSIVRELVDKLTEEKEK